MFSGLFRKSAAEKAADDEKIQASLAKTRQGFFGRIGTLFQANEITDDTWDELEELLIQADLGVNTALEVVERLQERVQNEGLQRVEDVRAALKDELVALLADPTPSKLDEPRMLTVVLIVGVNGSGKTTSIAKLAVLLPAAGAHAWCWPRPTPSAPPPSTSSRSGASASASSVIAQAPGADPGAVVFDAIRASQESRKADMLIIDTAGRLHTKYNLMKELEKVRAVCCAAGARRAARDAAGAGCHHGPECHQPGQALQGSGRRSPASS